MPHDAPEPLAHAHPRPSIVESDAAEYLGYTRRYLKQMRQFGKGPAFIRVGRSIRYRVRDLDAWQEAHRVVPRG